MADILSLQNVHAGYGSSLVINDFSLRLAQGQSLALLGRNGMGKTSLLNTIMGLSQLYSGSVFFADQNISSWASHKRARLGIAWVSQERDIFSSLTVAENLTVVARPGPWGLEQVYALFPRLAERKNNMGDQLSGGEQQMLAMARALMLNPRLLLLDEPLEGLAPLIVQELLDIIAHMLQNSNLTVILVDQYAHRALPLTHETIVLERGAIAYSGQSKELMADTDLIKLYLGANAGI